MSKHKPPSPDAIDGQASKLDQLRSTPRLCFNWEDWLPYLENVEGTDAQKRELIETLWQIVSVFVDLGWEINSEPEGCGQNFDLTAALRASVVYSKDHQQKEEV